MKTGTTVTFIVETTSRPSYSISSRTAPSVTHKDRVVVSGTVCDTSTEDGLVWAEIESSKGHRCEHLVGSNVVNRIFPNGKIVSYTFDRIEQH